MKITVAICTWNRARLLDQTLEQMRRLVIPDGVSWELLAVNNNSTDDTAAVLERHRTGLPLRPLFEVNQGHSYSRNCALAHAQGDLVLWTDDDVLVAPDWLAAFAWAARDWPEAAYFGGLVEPWFETPPPPWIKRHLPLLESVYAVRDFGPDVRKLSPKEGIVGASMAFRREATAGMQFDTGLGRVGQKLTSGDDSDYLGRLIDKGHYGVWVGAARLQHFVPGQRLTAKYIWDWHRGYAQFRVRCAGAASFQGPRIRGVPRWVLGLYLRARLRAALLCPFKTTAWLEAFLDCARWRGTIDCFAAGRPT